MWRACTEEQMQTNIALVMYLTLHLFKTQGDLRLCLFLIDKTLYLFSQFSEKEEGNRKNINKQHTKKLL